MSEELDNLIDAEVFLKALPHEEDTVAKKSLVLLADESKLFEQCMLLQVAAIEWVMRDAPITDDGLRGALALANWVFHQLRCGWLALIKGYYAVALHSLRDIEQATVTEVAVTLDANIARKFWEGNLEDREATKGYWSALEEENADDAEVRGEARKAFREGMHSFVHPRALAAWSSLVMSQDRSYATPTPGGFFTEENCRNVGNLYVAFAFYAAMHAGQAFKRVLSAEGEWQQRLKKVIGEYESVSSKWSHKDESL